MNKRNKIVALIAIIFIIVGGILIAYYRRSPSNPSTLQSVSLRLPIPAVDTAFAPYYLAIDKGIFAKYGLDVKLEAGTPELNPIKMVSQGTDQFGIVGGPELLFSGRSKGAPIIGIALLHKDADFTIIVALKKSGITKLEDLQGKKVGFFYGHISTDILHMLFKKQNIQVQEVDVGFDYGQLISQNIDAEWAFRTTAGISLPARGVEINTISPADYGILTQGHTLITNENWAKDNPALAQSFLNAVLEATKYSIEHQQEAIDAAIKRDPNFKQEVGQKQMEIYTPTILKNKRIGWIAPEDMERTKQQMLDLGLIQANFDTKSAYTVQFLESYYQGKE
jgi:NitT/TauT family transport system substrate-binding protein